MKKRIGAMLRKILPLKIYKLVANGFIIVPSYYSNIIKEAELHYDMAMKDDSDEKTLLLLRKYAHIIDKGLHRRDAAPGHSKSIYRLLQASINRLENTPYADDPTFIWAKEKAQKYRELQMQPESFVAFHNETSLPKVSYDDLFSLIKQRRSNRIFEEKLLTDSVVQQLKVVVDWAANSCNKQPIRLFCTNSSELAKKCLSCCKGGTGFSEFIPSFWVFTADVRGYVYPSEIFLPAIDTSLGAQNFFLSATTLGLSGTILSWAQKNADEEKLLRSLLSIPDNYEIIFCAVLGYAQVNSVPPQRKNTI